MEVEDSMIDSSALVRDFLYQAGVTERLAEDDVTEVIINRPGEIWTEKNGRWKTDEVPYLDFAFCMKLANCLMVNEDKLLSRPLVKEIQCQ